MRRGLGNAAHVSLAEVHATVAEAGVQYEDNPGKAPVGFDATRLVHCREFIGAGCGWSKTDDVSDTSSDTSSYTSAYTRPFTNSYDSKSYWTTNEAAYGTTYGTTD